MKKTKSSGINYFSLLGLLCIFAALPAETYVLFKLYCFVSDKIPAFWVCLPVILVIGCCIALTIIALSKAFDVKKLWQICIASILGLLVSACVGIAETESSAVKSEMQIVTADEYYGFSEYMEFSSLSFDDIFNTLSKSSAREYVTGYDGEDVTVWEYLDYDKLLGTTSKEAEESFNESKNLTAYYFTFDYRNLHEIDTMWLLKNPSKLFGNITNLKKFDWHISLSHTSYELPFAVKAGCDILFLAVLPEIVAIIILKKYNKISKV